MNHILSKYLNEIANLLEASGDKHWASWLRQDAVSIENGDIRGIRHFLSAFGGMGSINDSYGFFDPKKKETELSKEEIISSRLDAAWNLARLLIGKE
jgi:hypothetical protein